MSAHLRIARPVTDLANSTAMYRDGLGLRILGTFENHEGFDGVMLGHECLSHHFEFTCCRTHPVVPAPTPEDLLVFYLPEPAERSEAHSRILAAGFKQVSSFNPYWEVRGRTFEDLDGYRIVLQQAQWPNVEA
ncbi:VOC family protein [Acidithiobacillus acidisediminis]|uniref:VOC family protein n=1 Tax=Acidithiobacillus acidisediminis TaxID=2937799 RepID=UPI00200ED2FB|nr:VOC family protein [Acidithiobacillus sp. S30A2]